MKKLVTFLEIGLIRNFHNLGRFRKKNGRDNRDNEDELLMSKQNVLVMYDILKYLVLYYRIQQL